MNLEQLRTKIEKQTDELAKTKLQQLTKEYAAKEKQRKQLRQQQELARKADAHRKIELGGLVIAAGVDEWNPAEIVAGLLYVRDGFIAKPELRDTFREKGIAYLQAREQERSKK